MSAGVAGSGGEGGGLTAAGPPIAADGGDVADKVSGRLTRGVAGWRKLARLVLWWEAVWALAWPVPAVLALFAAVALFDVLPRLPGWLHAVVLAVFAAGLVAALLPLRRLSWPTREEALRRIERDSGLAHRPLQSLSDRLATGDDDPLASTLWRMHQDRLRGATHDLTVRLPDAQLPRRDPLGLRFAPFLLLAIALSGAWPDAPSRLLRAMEPRLAGWGGPPAILQVWITRPDYTHLAPILLESAKPDTRIIVPVGSKLLAELQGGYGSARLVIDGASQPFVALDADSQRLETTINKGNRLEVRQGYRTIGAWDIGVLTDHPPVISFAAPPDSDNNGRLRLDIEAHDDYGVAKAWVEIRRVDRPDMPPLAVALPVAGNHPADLRQATWHDLTGHPWAGLPVTIRPVAEDDAGQQGNGAKVSLTLPERRFTNPVARAIVAQRRILATDASAASRAQVSAALAGIADNIDSYHRDILVFLALVDAHARLRFDSSTEATSSVLDILWQTALRVEEGDRPMAQRAVDQASRDLEQALADGASPAELQRLTDQLEQAMAQYLAALAKDIERRGLQPMPVSPDQQVVTPDQLQDMINRMRDLARTGSRDAARQMLSQMRQMLDNLNAAMQSAGSDTSAGQALQALDALGAIDREQRQLLDETFRRDQQGAEIGDGEDDGFSDVPSPRRALPPVGGNDMGPSAGGKDGATAADDAAANQAAVARQEDLRQRLGKLLEQLGELGLDIPDALGQAEQAMRDAGQALRDGALQDAVDAQTEAVDRLEQGAKAAMAALAKQMGNGIVVRGAGGMGRDPLGRPLNSSGAPSQNDVKLPNQSDVQKAREVLDELRDRASQAERPPDERDYLHRLLKQFF
jgi:uncharacterized protein (TIGR02302 family)